jgi:hypothetical protein
MYTGMHMPTAVHSRIPGTDFQYGSRFVWISEFSSIARFEPAAAACGENHCYKKPGDMSQVSPAKPEA